jgi:hypothetical protein
MRLLLTMLVPLVLPTALYVLWAMTLGRHAPSGRRAPWPWLAGAGVVLAVAVLVTVAETSGSRDGRYVPPHEENGQIVPGHVVPAGQ